MNQPEEKTKSVNIEAAQFGWIVRIDGQPTKAFTRWRLVVRLLEAELTDHGQKADINHATA